MPAGRSGNVTNASLSPGPSTEVPGPSRQADSVMSSWRGAGTGSGANPVPDFSYKLSNQE